MMALINNVLTKAAKKAAKNRYKGKLIQPLHTENGQEFVHVKLRNVDYSGMLHRPDDYIVIPKRLKS